MPEEVESEVKHVFTIIKDILLIPLLPILIPLGKKNFMDFFRPLIDFWKFFWDAKFVAIMILINIIVFFGVSIYAGVNYPNPADFENSNLFGLFWNKPTDMLNPFSIKFLSIFLSGFMHSNIWHLLGNMLALFALGRVVEKKLGFIKTTLIYFLAIIASSLVDSIFGLIMKSGIPSTGASGGIAGLSAGALLLGPLAITFISFIPLPVIIVSFGWLISDLKGIAAYAAGQSNVAVFAHLGGFFLTIPMMFLLYKEDRGELIKGLIISIVLIATVFIMKYFGLHIKLLNMIPGVNIT